jgi:histidine triad (HIT) family protein
MTDCLFCKIAAGQIPSDKVYEDEYALVFKDIKPAAPTHLLAIPKDHYQTIQDIPAEKTEVMQRLFIAIAGAVEKLNLGPDGYRLVINSGEHAGQLIPHLHVHILAGRDLAWPPG